MSSRREVHASCSWVPFHLLQLCEMALSHYCSGYTNLVIFVEIQIFFLISSVLTPPPPRKKKIQKRTLVILIYIQQQLLKAEAPLRLLLKPFQKLLMLYSRENLDKNMQTLVRFQKLNSNMEKVEANLPTVPTALMMMNGSHWLNALPVTP